MPQIRNHLLVVLAGNPLDSGTRLQVPSRRTAGKWLSRFREHACSSITGWSRRS